MFEDLREEECSGRVGCNDQPDGEENILLPLESEPVELVDTLWWDIDGDVDEWDNFHFYGTYTCKVRKGDIENVYPYQLKAVRHFSKTRKTAYWLIEIRLDLVGLYHLRFEIAHKGCFKSRRQATKWAIEEIHRFEQSNRMKEEFWGKLTECKVAVVKKIDDRYEWVASFFLAGDCLMHSLTTKKLLGYGHFWTCHFSRIYKKWAFGHYEFQGWGSYSGKKIEDVPVEALAAFHGFNHELDSALFDTLASQAAKPKIAYARGSTPQKLMKETVKSYL